MSGRIIGTRYASLDDVYAAIPDTPCTGACSLHCVLVTGSRREAMRTRQANSGQPVLVAVSRPNGTPCPAVTDDGRCGVHPVRPTICRLFGAVTGLGCPYGCVPERMLTDDEGAWLLGEAQRLGGRMRRKPGM